MSIRRDVAQENVRQLQKELADLKAASIETPTQAGGETATAPAGEAVPSFDSLSNTEKAAASLGVQPEAFKPIAWLNEGHYNNLLKSNALDDQLARRIEAYKTVASSSC